MIKPVLYEFGPSLTLIYITYIHLYHVNEMRQANITSMHRYQWLALQKYILKLEIVPTTLFITFSKVSIFPNETVDASW